VALLREGVIQREKAKDEAQVDLNVCQQRVETARKDYQFALRAKEKFQMLTEIYDKAAFQEAERLSDLELEEVHITTHDFSDWENSND
jgi:flagellar biosynthesis chaperone FliJ